MWYNTTSHIFVGLGGLWCGYVWTPHITYTPLDGVDPSIHTPAIGTPLWLGCIDV